MTSTPVANESIEQYLTRLEACLHGVAPSVREEILREIRAHIVDVVAGATDPTAVVERVLRLLGTPEELAGRYMTENLLIDARRSFSPWVLLRTCYRWAAMGVKGTMAFLIGLFGYLLAFTMGVAVILKPFVPSKVGLWVGPQGINLGMSNSHGAHELLGQSFIPVITITAFAIAVGTTQLLRWMMRKRSPKPNNSQCAMELSGPAHV